MRSKKPKNKFDSEQQIECGYCGVKMVRRQLKEHTRTSCTVGKGKKIWEKAPKGQPTLSFQSKKKVNCETSSFFYQKLRLSSNKR